MLLIGSHMEMKAPEYLEGAVRQTIANDANALMIYSGAPQNTKRKDISLFHIAEGQALMKQAGILPTSLIIHAPYIINLANTTNPATYEIAVKSLREELKRCQAMSATTLVLHPGSHVGAGEEAGITNIIRGLNEIRNEMGNVDIALETMSGKGSELGTTFAQIKAIMDGVIDASQLKICLDTCHLHDAGYRIDDFDEVLSEFTKYLPLEKIKVVHINDSKNELGSRKDRHENFGFGKIGFDSLLGVVYHPSLANVVKILETPYINKEFAPYQKEISMIRRKQFDENLFADLRPKSDDSSIANIDIEKAGR